MHPDMPAPTHLHELFHRLGCQGVRTEEGVGVIWEDRGCVCWCGVGAGPSSSHSLKVEIRFSLKNQGEPKTSTLFIAQRPRVVCQAA